MSKNSIKLMVLITLFLFSSTTNAQNDLNVKINGMIQLWGMHSGDSNTNSTFLLKRSEVKLSGFILSNTVGYEFLLDPASVPTHLIQDLNIFYQFDPRLKVTVGQMKYPLTMEGLQPSSQLDFIERTIITAREFGDRRDIGLLVSGKYNLVEYAVGAFNGSGRTPRISIVARMLRGGSSSTLRKTFILAGPRIMVLTTNCKMIFQPSKGIEPVWSLLIRGIT